jgi:two-component system, LytTR family, sensor histidine kinase AlgZ
MHPILGHRGRRRAFWVLWVFVGATIGVLPLVWAGGRLEDAWGVALWGEVLAVPMLASAYVTRAAPLATASPARVVTTIGGAALLIAAVWLALGGLWLWAVSWAAPTPYAVFDAMRGPAFVGVVAVFVVMSAIHYAIAAADERQIAVARVLEAEIATREAELRALRSQVDPHFLFNCLHSISALIASDPPGARRMCLELAEFFRESLRAGARTRVPLITEAALVRRYLEIERLRFGDRLNVTIDVAPDAEQTLVPPLLLQPLAENAVRHGIATLVEGGDVTITARRQGDRVEVCVENRFDADGRRPGTGVGLRNVRERLDSTYGSRAVLTIDAADARFRAAISLPAEDAS